jgi:hypothetical protein
MARKGGSKSKNRSLTSRKTKFKDVSSAMLDNAYSKKSGAVAADPPKAGFDTQVPRKMREMMWAMQRAKDKEAGKHVAWRAHREDLPRPERVRPAKKRKGDHAEDTPPSRDAADGAGASVVEPDAKQKRAKVASNGPVSEVHDAVQQKHARASTSSKPIDFERSKAPKFGATNMAPPEIRVGGQLKKKLLQQQAKADLIARQRDDAMKAYAAAKLARRQGQQPRGQPDDRL